MSSIGSTPKNVDQQTKQYLFKLRLLAEEAKALAQKALDAGQTAIVKLERQQNAVADDDDDSGTDDGTCCPIDLPFAFGDATPSAIGEHEGVFIATSIVITEAFNGTGAALSIGSMGDHELLMPAAANVPGEVGRYEFNPSLRLSPTALFLFITPGFGATQGRGVVYMERSA